jgi:integrase/recombinase XerC
MATYFNPLHPSLDMTHPDVCSYVNDYLHYAAVIQGRSLQTAFNYYVDLKEFFSYLCEARGLSTPEAAYDQTVIDLPFLEKITTSEVYEFLYMLQRQKGCKATTRNRKLSALRGFFRYMTVSVHLLAADPTAGIDNAKKARTLPKYLSEEQSIELLKNIQSDFYERDYCMLTLFLNCGMRLQELVRIDLSDCKPDTILLHGKGNKQRIAYLTPACQEALAHYLDARSRLKTIPESDRNALFLSRRTGRRLSPRRVEQIVERCLASAGLAGKGFSPHKLRHTAATLMYQSGQVDILELKELLGHANVATTQIYTHLDPTQLRSAANASPLAKMAYHEPPKAANTQPDDAGDPADAEPNPEDKKKKSSRK